MNVKNVLHLVLVLVVGQVLFSCNSARYYDFSAHKQAPYLQQPKQKVKPVNNEALESLQEIALAAVEEKEAAEAEAATAALEANAAATPTVAPKAVKPLPDVMAEDAPEKAMTEAEAIAAAKERMASMSTAEKRALKKEIRDTLRQDGSDVSTVVKVILAIFIPPLAVFLHEGIGSTFWINLLLTILLFVPGVIHALLVVTDTI